LIGKRLAHYEITGLLGKGGMGEVYKAEDTKLGREVALKVLPSEMAENAEHLERFQREAKVLAALNHPNIVTVYSIEEDDGVRFLTMERIRGETLSRLIPAGGMSLERMFKVAISLADALAAAHVAGIVHRDLKPANLMVTEEGRLKVLDFGLAKLRASDEQRRQSLATTEPLTRAGEVLGTVPYMSPEQLEAKEPDCRSDIFSFGVILYEMATGEPPFAGDSSASLITAICRDTPPNVDAVRTDLPHHLGRIVRRCLAKEPDRRYQSALDLRNDIEDLREEIGRGGVVEATEASTPSRPLRARLPRRLGFTLAVLAAGATLGGFAIWTILQRETPPRRTTRFSLDVELPAEEAFSTIALSPDGLTLAFVSDSPRQLFLHSLDEFESRPIDGTTGAAAPFFSPDGRWVGFWSSGKLRKVEVSGGPVLPIIATSKPYGATWGPDGTIVFAKLAVGLRVLAAGSSSIEPLTESTAYSPEFLPGGKAILFTSRPGGISAVSIETRERRQILDLPASTAHYVPTGHIVFAQGSSLWAVPFDVDALERTGDPFLVSGQSVQVDPRQATFVVASDGTLVFAPHDRGDRRRLVWVDRNGAGTPIPFDVQSYLHPRLSPDGRRVATTIAEPDDWSENIWVLDLERGTETPLTAEGRVNRWPVWTHSGKEIVFTSTRGGGYFDLFRAPADGSSEPRILLSHDEVLIPMSWAPAHESLAYYRTRSGAADIWTLGAERAPSLLLATESDERSPRFAPDGKWLAYVSNESGRDEVYLRPYPGPGARLPVSNDGGIEVSWSHDGGELYYRKGTQMMVVSVSSGESMELGTPRLLFDGPYMLSPIGRGNANYDVAADGRFVMVEALPDAGRPKLHVVLNWLEELRRQSI